MNRHQRRAASKKNAVASKGAQAITPASLCDLGRSLLGAGLPVEAQDLCQRALAIDPNHADSMLLRGEIALHSGQFDQAVEWVSNAIKLDLKAEYVSTLGTVLQRAGRLEEAMEAFDKAISLQPENAEFWKSIGAVLIDLNRSDEALLALEHALKLRPRYVDAANLSGLILHRREQYSQALEHFNLSLEVKPDQADALYMRALSYLNLKRFEEARADNYQSYLLNQQDADTTNNLGTALQNLGRYEESLEWFDRAIALRPDFALALHNKGHSLTELQRVDEAFACYARSLEIDPENPKTQWNVALLQMLVGDFEPGWVGRESRWKLGLMHDPQFTQPRWLGGSIEGKTILLYADEGIGDSFQFARYIPMVAALGARVIVVAAAPACSLMSRLDGVAECLPKKAMLPAFDVYCHISSLPLAFKTTLKTIPAAVPYLPAPAGDLRIDWERRLGPRNRLRVGLVWSGSAGHINDHNRSMPLRELTKTLDVDAMFVSLQKDLRDQDKEILAGGDIIDLTDSLSDFGETSALVSCLDLVISVDTSVAHLAGGLGCPVWILLPYSPDYRWLYNREDSPWYPTARLFRQTEEREWPSVVKQVRTELGALTEDWRHKHVLSKPAGDSISPPLST